MCIQPKMTEKQDIVLILGGGMAGLTAARHLAEAGLQVILLEAKDRIGGRVHTVLEHGEVIELGAEFIHGRPRELWDLIEEAGEETYEIDGSRLGFANGVLRERDEQEASIDFMETLRDWAGPDLSFSEYLDRETITGEQRVLATRYVEGFNAADYRVIGVASLAVQQRAEDQIEGGRAFRLRRGYGRLVSFLEKKIKESGGQIVTGAVAKSVAWSAMGVDVVADKSGSTSIFRAKRCICALPLGVLQQGNVAFHPTPRALAEALRLRMGSACRFTLVFRERFWQHLEPRALQELSFLFSFDLNPRVWWTAHPGTSNTLTGWSGGPDAENLFPLSTEELASLACEQLSQIFSLDKGRIRELLIGCYSHNWSNDPFASGAYSYVPAGALDASGKMAIPEDGSALYFAGEHTDTTGHWGTVHAAIRSGIRAAGQILDDMAVA